MEHASLTGREVLERIKELQHKIGKYEEDLIRYKMLSQRVSGGVITGMPFNPNQRTDAIFTSYVESIEIIDDRIKECNTELDALKEIVWENIKDIKDVDAKSMMSLKHIEGININESAVILNLSKSSAYRKYKTGEREFLINFGIKQGIEKNCDIKCDK